VKDREKERVSERGKRGTGTERTLPRDRISRRERENEKTRVCVFVCVCERERERNKPKGST